jgi:branched-chain amino acid transport system permease protein
LTRISPDAAFSLIDWTAYVIFIVVIGGIGTMEGPVIGVAIFYLLQYYLAALGSWYLILLGALAILLMLFAPSGVWGVISHALDLSLFPVRRRLIAETFSVKLAGTADRNESSAIPTCTPPSAIAPSSPYRILGTPSSISTKR